MTVTTKYQGKVLQLNEEQFLTPTGVATQLEIVRHPGGAAALAINQRRECCLIKQFRYATGDWIWEIPAGRIEHLESPLVTAQRELREEAGVVAESWRKLGAIWSTPGFSDEVIHLYLAENLTMTATNKERDECIEVHWLTMEHCKQFLASQPIVDAKTLAVFYHIFTSPEP